MATADACKRAPLTCIWIIENFSKLTYEIDLVSPLFVADSIRKAEWCIKIRGGVTFRCSLYTRNIWEKIFSAMDIEFSLLAADGSPLISKRDPESIFQIDLLTKPEFLERSTEFLPSNTLTVQCRMWIKGREIPTMDLCYARTRLRTHTGSFTWPIEDFGALQISAAEHSNKHLALNERKVYPLKSFTQKGPFMALILYLKRYFESEDVYVDALIKKGRDYIFFNCEFSVIDANGEVIASQKKEIYTHFGVAVLGSCALISKNKLIGNKNLFLPNDTLLLKGSFEACTGVLSSEIEYCTPNVSSIVKEEKEDLDFDDDFSCPSGYEEYFIKKVEENDLVHNSVEEKMDSNSCNWKCSLKAALRYLQIEATLSDVCLQIGTKLYPAHKNILCSRSPVFSRDIQGNIIEINGMDENTLRRLLQYIYTDTVGDLQFENALDLFKAAADYQLFDLKDKCSDFLITNLTKINVRDMLSLAIKYQNEKLEMAAREFTSGVGKKFKSTRDS